MQLINAPGKLVLPFANAGAKNTIPVASQIGIVAGAASLTDGFPPLTRTPLAAGGVPPSGLDMNGIIYELSAILRWANAGAGYVYDGTFAADSNVGGYPKGARVLRSDGQGYWFNTTDNNTTDPEGAGAVAAGWVPDFTNGVAAVTMTGSNVTLTPLQYGKPVIVITGTLTANLNLIFPNLAGEWTVVNNCTGAFTVTAKTAAGTGAVITPGRTRIIWGDGTNIAGAMNEVETPAQFDNSTSLPTTAFVQRALGNFSGESVHNVDTQLTGNDFGRLVIFAGASVANRTFTLPPAAAGASGCKITFWNNSSYNLTVVPFAGDFLDTGTSVPASIVLGPGSTLVCETFSSVGWRLIEGTARLKNSSEFFSSLASSGYQKLPSGLILQWGTQTPAGGAKTYSFPLAFPTTCLSFTATPDSSSAIAARANGVNATTYSIETFDTTNGSLVSATTRWIAVGY